MLCDFAVIAVAVAARESVDKRGYVCNKVVYVVAHLPDVVLSYLYADVIYRKRYEGVIVRYRIVINKFYGRRRLVRCAVGYPELYIERKVCYSAVFVPLYFARAAYTDVYAVHFHFRAGISAVAESKVYRTAVYYFLRRRFRLIDKVEHGIYVQIVGFIGCVELVGVAVYRYFKSAAERAAAEGADCRALFIIYIIGKRYRADLNGAAVEEQPDELVGVERYREPLRVCGEFANQRGKVEREHSLYYALNIAEVKRIAA